MSEIILCMIFVVVLVCSIYMDCFYNNNTVYGGMQKISNGIRRPINIITKQNGEQLAKKLSDTYDVVVMQSYPEFNRPSFITITDIKPLSELPSSYILWIGQPNDVPNRAISIKPEDIFTRCNELSDGALAPAQQTISMYNVGEHIFTKKPPSKDTFNYDQSFDIWVDDRDTLIRESAMKGVPYEKYMTACLSAFIGPNATVLDIGTNVGTVSLPLSRLPGSTVVSFEPFPETYGVLFKNIIQNKAYNIVPIRMCVGDKWRKEITLSDNIIILPHHKDKKGKPQQVDISKINTKIHFGAIHVGEGSIKSSMTSIDDLNINISAMKVDVEGAEPLVFYGAKETIKRCMPIIVFERNENKVSSEMIRSLNLTNDVINFNILEYCRTLGYSDFYELDIQDYMLIPPTVKQIETESIAKFTPVKTIKGFTPKETVGYNLFHFVRPRWNEK